MNIRMYKNAGDSDRKNWISFSTGVKEFGQPNSETPKYCILFSLISFFLFLPFIFLCSWTYTCFKSSVYISWSQVISWIQVFYAFSRVQNVTIHECSLYPRISQCSPEVNFISIQIYYNYPHCVNLYTYIIYNADKGLVVLQCWRFQKLKFIV